MIRAVGACLTILVAASALSALELPTTARLQVERISPLDQYALPVGPFADGAVPAEIIEGRVERRSWRIDGGSSTSFQILAPLRDQMIAQGYDIVFECADTACGGFDFRFATEVLSGPHMYVDLGDFRFLSARRGPDDVQSLLVSRSAASVYIQNIQAGSGLFDAGATASKAVAPASTGESLVAKPNAGGDLVSRLLAEGHVVLSDLEFQTGANTLGEGPFPSLQELADFISADDAHRIVFVGHTDSIGALSSNIALSKSRAEAVRYRIIQDFGVPSSRVGAEGMGYLAPVATNLTEAGREANRRVEAILLAK